MFLMFAANSLRVGRRWQSANIIAKNASEMHQQLCNNPSKAMQNQSKIDQNGAKERSESDLGSKSVPGFQKSGHGFEKWMQFLRHLGDFGRHFGPSWAPRGSQNRAFGRQGVPKAAKIASKKRSKKKLDFLIEF